LVRKHEVAIHQHLRHTNVTRFIDLFVFLRHSLFTFSFE
jgi:hypothetical protein